jgi:hypothetical protein
MKTSAYGAALADCDAALQMDPEYTKVGLIHAFMHAIHRRFILSNMFVLSMNP